MMNIFILKSTLVIILLREFKLIKWILLFLIENAIKSHWNLFHNLQKMFIKKSPAYLINKSIVTKIKLLSLNAVQTDNKNNFSYLSHKKT